MIDEGPPASSRAARFPKSIGQAAGARMKPPEQDGNVPAEVPRERGLPTPTEGRPGQDSETKVALLEHEVGAEIRKEGGNPESSR